MSNKNKYRVSEPDKYNGSKESKERLRYLFYITKLNIKDFLNIGNSYVKYLTEKLNQIQEDKKVSNIDNYDIVFERIFKITEVDNVGNLTRLLFNVLVSFDAFNSYISSELKSLSHNELKEFIQALQPLMVINIPNCSNTIDLPFFISEVRNTFVHNGKYIAQFSLLPSDDNKHYVPGLSITLKNVFNKEFLDENNLNDDDMIDTIETFNIIDKNINQLETILDNVLK